MARPIDGELLKIAVQSWIDTQSEFVDVETCEMVLAVISVMPTLAPPNEWVSVEERLPAPTENLVLVYGCTGVNMAWYSYAMGWMYRTGLPGVEITHWMPLPEPPKEETP